MSSTAKIIALIAMLQGLAVLVLKRSLEAESWLVSIPSLHVALWTVVLTVPLLTYLLLDSDNHARCFRSTAVTGLVLGLIAAYIGYEMSPFNEFPVDSIVAIYIASITIVTFKISVFCRSRWLDRTNDYVTLLRYSWRHAFIVAGSLLFTGILWVVLALWAGIFNLIGIDFFDTLFYQDWFALPLSTVAIAAGILIFRQIDTLIDTLTRFFRVLLQYLLPLLAAVAVLFLISLPFQGISSLWENGLGTSLLLWMSALLLFFTNAVFQGDRAAIYPAWILKVISLMLLSLPIISLLGAYGMWLRIDQYGWTIARFWGALTTLFLLTFSLGYGWLIAAHREAWTQYLGKVNVPMAWALTAVLLVVNSPLLNPRTLALESQLNQAEVGAQIQGTDWQYIHRYLGRPGYQEINRVADLNPQLTREELLQLDGDKELLVSDRIVILGALSKLPPQLMEALNIRFQASPLRLFVAQISPASEYPRRFIASNESGYSWLETVLVSIDESGKYTVEPLEKLCSMSEEQIIQHLEEGQITTQIEEREIISIGNFKLQRMQSQSSPCEDSNEEPTDEVN